MTAKAEGAQVDVETVKVQEQFRQSYGNKVCPIMSIGGQKFSGGLVTGLGERAASQAEAEVVACLGPSCQFFCITAQDKAGRPTGGGCALALLPAAVFNLQQTVAAGLSAVFPHDAEPENQS